MRRTLYPFLFLVRFSLRLTTLLLILLSFTLMLTIIGWANTPSATLIQGLYIVVGVVISLALGVVLMEVEEKIEKVSLL